MKKQVTRQQIEKIVSDGNYAKEPSFNHHRQNLQALIRYIEHLQPSLENIENSYKLIKFYRLPIVIAFRCMYERIIDLDKERAGELEERLKDIASFVASMIELTEIKVFDEIKFAFVWGRTKKKYKINISPAEVSFAKLVYNLSLEKKNILLDISKGNYSSERDYQDRITKLDDMGLSRSMTVFEQYSINYLKESVINQIQRLEQTLDKRQTIQTLQTNQPQREKGPSVKAKKSPQKKLERKVQSSQALENTRQMQPELGFKSTPEQQYRVQKMNVIEEQLQYEAERKLPMCCRRYFINQQVIEQPENLRIEYKYYNYPFKDRPDEQPSKAEKIKKTICGFLNSEGGILFFGIKENSTTKKREADGLTVSEKRKLQFRHDIFGLLKEVLPDAHSRCALKWVPVRSKQTGEFLHGRYVAKVIIQKGAKDQIYSYVQNNVQMFAFKTENEVLIIQQAQKILKMLYDKVKYPEKVVYQLHKHPCLEPLTGKPVYTEPQYNPFEQYQDFPMISEYSQRSDPKPQSVPKKRYMEKGTNDYILFGVTREQIKAQFSECPQKLGSMQLLAPQLLSVKIHDPQTAQYLQVKGLNVIPVYKRVKYTLDKEILEEILDEIQKNEKIVIKKRQNGILSFENEDIAIKFWLKVRDIDLSAIFTPET